MVMICSRSFEPTLPNTMFLSAIRLQRRTAQEVRPFGVVNLPASEIRHQQVRIEISRPGPGRLFCVQILSARTWERAAGGWILRTMTRVVLELKAVDGGIDIAVERQYGSDATDEEKATALAMQVFFEDVGE